jgi:hypothetical protein
MAPEITRTEHLLWMVPVISGAMIYVTSHTEMVMVYYSGTYLLLSYFLATLIFLATLLIPFILHHFMRQTEERSFIISWAHVMLSISIIASVLFIYSRILPINTHWRYHVGELNPFKRWSYYNSMAVLFTQIYIALQLLYSVYATVMITRHYLHSSRKLNEEYDFMNGEYNESESGLVQQMIA